ncbi:hypothetical protein HID58_079878 [Brassica napus]|uniref:Uncharacterized protein n=1 Tax=Brassica napus TaxID=3708 RepID=A0ABQ7Y399_BRANA|nr:hypothetical protein HID58_079878 [Brassica napus]
MRLGKSTCIIHVLLTNAHDTYHKQHIQSLKDVEILSSDGSDIPQDVNPHARRRPPGRPRKNRILSRGEFQILSFDMQKAHIL